GDMVLQEGSTQWKPASQVQELLLASGSPPPPIPVAEATEWHFSQGGKQSGPITMSDLKGLALAGSLRPDDLVWKAGMPGWVAASPAGGVSPPRAVPPMPPPLPNEAAQAGKNPAISRASGAANQMMAGIKQAADETGISGLFGSIGRGLKDMLESSAPTA